MLHELPVKDKSDAEKLLKIAPFRRGVRKTLPHKHNNYFEIIFFTAGAGYHVTDQVKYEVRPPVAFFVRKDQVHFLDLNEDVEPAGYVLIIKSDFITLCTDKELKQLLSEASSMSSVYLEPQPAITTLFGLIEQENNRAHPYKNQQHCLEGLLKALLVKLVSLSAPQPDHQARRTDLYHAFREKLGLSKPIKNNVAYYAALLNTTPQNLNAMCRKQSGQSATGVIAEFTISEARRLLIYTDNTVSQIALLLDFGDASHFVKYFKRYADVTPQSYRLIHS
ncbi:MAG: helix-turn-helix domain-containing protein [Bacteroidetes bacterium]|nr:helix-turn-helix domain-containing protein [Bacteroidota bacterium]